MNEKDFWKRQVARWSTLPFGKDVGHVKSSEALEWTDQELSRKWNMANLRGWANAKWYLLHYADKFRGQDVLDIGPGIGLDGIYLAQHGARMVFADIAPDNLKLLERICELKKVRAAFIVLEGPYAPDFGIVFDAIMSIGMIHHSPFEMMKSEMASFTYYLKPGGTMAGMVYPKERWEAHGRPSFEEFAIKTDWAGTPWAEWYDREKILRLFGDNFRLNWWQNFNHDKFAWFDLTKIKNGPRRYEGPDESPPPD